jgi:ABC-type Fe3+ transport system permease subunit
MQVAWALPWCVGAIVMGLVGMERSLEESALLDAGTWTTIRTATLPQLRPSLAFAAVVAALPALTDMSATDLFQVRTLTEEIYTNLNESQAGERATVLALLPLAIAFSGAVTRTMPRKYRFESVRWQERLIFRWNPVAVMIAVLGFLGMTPLLLVFAGLIWQMGLTGGDPETARWSAPLAWSYFSVEITRLGPMLARELPRSLLVSASAVIIAFPLAWIVRCSGTHTRHLVLGFSAWLFVIPGPVIALGIIDTFQSPLLPSVLATWYGTSFPLIWGHTIKLLPLTTLALSVAMARLNDDMLENAEIAGAGFWSSAFRVAIPACEGPIVLSWIVGALYLLGELPTGKLLAPPGGEPVAIRLFALLHQGTGNRQAAAALVLGCVAMLSVGCLLLLIRSHRQRIAADP